MDFAISFPCFFGADLPLRALPQRKGQREKRKAYHGCDMPEGRSSRGRRENCAGTSPEIPAPHGSSAEEPLRVHLVLAVSVGHRLAASCDAQYNNVGMNCVCPLARDPGGLRLFSAPMAQLACFAGRIRSMEMRATNGATTKKGPTTYSVVSPCIYWLRGKDLNQ